MPLLPCKLVLWLSRKERQGPSVLLSHAFPTLKGCCLIGNLMNLAGVDILIPLRYFVPLPVSMYVGF